MLDGWADYCNISPILFPRRVIGSWSGNHLPPFPEDYADPKDPDDFDLENPETDYERGWAAQELSGVPPVLEIVVGDAPSLLFSAHAGWIKWWPEKMMLVSSFNRQLPDSDQIGRVEWKSQFDWRPSEREYVLMSSWDHPANPKKGLPFLVDFEITTYDVQYGLDKRLFRFVPKSSV